MKFLNILAFFILNLGISQGLKCWHCEEAKDDEECKRKGRLQICQSNEETCFTETRLIQADRKLIFRRCKQDLACKNNAVQNRRPAWHPTQCNEIQGSVCRCCCKTDGCNGDQMTACEVKYNPMRVTPCQVVDSIPNGRVACRSYLSYTRSQVHCAYECNPGYTMFGEKETKCLATFRKKPNDHEIPICLDLSLSDDFAMNEDEAIGRSCFKPEAPKNSDMLCSNSYYEEDSFCEFMCHPGFALQGREKITCKSSSEIFDDFYSADYDELSWDYDVPTCVPQCIPLSAPENGMMSCKPAGNIENSVGSVCHFTCEEGFDLIGNTESFCIALDDELAVYSDQAPVCMPQQRSMVGIKCPEQTNLRRVVKKCTDGNNYGSECQFTCERDLYTMEPGAIVENHCQINGTWSSEPPCCRLPCPPHTIMDLFVVLDSSSSVRKHNWKKMMHFVALVLSKLNLNVDRSQVFVIRYNDDVDHANQLLLRDNETIDEIEDALNSIPYDGKGTYTGNALHYVNDVLLHRPENRHNVTDVVLLLTDGRASDKVKHVSGTLRGAGVEMFAVGVGKNAKYKQLLEISGSEERLWQKMKDFDSLTTEAATRIGNHICEKSCTL